MIIKDLELTHFGKFHNKTVALKPGVNIIYGRNEAGKSTVHSLHPRDAVRHRKAEGKGFS